MISEKVTNYLKEKGWNYTENLEQGTFNFSLNGSNGLYRCKFVVEEDRQKLGFYSYCVAICPRDARIKTAELLMRFNSIIFSGNFELDFETGGILFKTGLFCHDIHLTTIILDNLVVPNVSVMDDFTPAILRLMYSPITAIEAFETRSGNEPKIES